MIKGLFLAWVLTVIAVMSGVSYYLLYALLAVNGWN